MAIYLSDMIGCGSAGCATGRATRRIGHMSSQIGADYLPAQACGEYRDLENNVATAVPITEKPTTSRGPIKASTKPFHLLREFMSL